MLKPKKIATYKIKEEKLFNQVFTHKSYKKSSIHNERLEFLGDAVLNFFIADLLMNEDPQASEGELTKKRSQIVSGKTLAKIAIDLDFSKLLKTELESYKTNPRILAGALEAYIGAVYLEGYFLEAKKLIKSLFNKIQSQDMLELNCKPILQEWCQKKYKELPVYKIRKEEGFQHKKTFFVDVFIKGKCLGRGSSYQKKQAEQKAAKQSLKKLKIFIK